MTKLKMRVRFDYKGKSRPGRFFGGKSSEEICEDIRQHQVSLIRNIPVQGIHIDEIDMSHEVYSIIDETNGKSISFAPVSICLQANSFEDAIKFIMKEEFRTIEVIEPPEVSLTYLEVEKLFLKMHEELLNYKVLLEKRLNNWK